MTSQCFYVKLSNLNSKVIPKHKCSLFFVWRHVDLARPTYEVGSDYIPEDF